MLGDWKYRLFWHEVSKPKITIEVSFRTLVSPIFYGDVLPVDYAVRTRIFRTSTRKSILEMNSRADPLK